MKKWAVPLVAVGLVAGFFGWSNWKKPADVPARGPAQTKFVIGYNEAWFGDDFLFSLVKTFDKSYVDKIFADIKAAGGDVVRVYLFQARQGLVLREQAPQTVGIDPKVMENIKSVILSAEAAGLKIYFTLHDANAMPPPSSPETKVRDYYYNMLHNKYGEGDAFNANVLSPLLELFSQHQDVIFGIDLANEIQAAIKHSYWGLFDEFEGPRRWMKSTRDFIRAKAPWARVSVSAMGPADLPGGLFSGIGLDFYDVHIYDDNGTINYVGSICAIVQKTGVPIIIGEYGQKTQRLDDELQAKVTRNLLENARSQCFSGAIAWRFDAADKIWRYQRPDGSLRPAVDVIKDFKSKL